MFWLWDFKSYSFFCLGMWVCLGSYLGHLLSIVVRPYGHGFWDYIDISMSLLSLLGELFILPYYIESLCHELLLYFCHVSSHTFIFPSLFHISYGVRKICTFSFSSISVPLSFLSISGIRPLLFCFQWSLPYLLFPLSMNLFHMV